jgi:hypothetical protein
MPFGLENTFDFLRQDIQDQMSLQFEVGWREAPTYRAAERGYLVELDETTDAPRDTTKVFFQFNPKELQLTHMQRMAAAQALRSVGRVAYGEHELKFSLIYDGTERNESVRDRADRVLGFVQPREQSAATPGASNTGSGDSSSTPRAPRVGFYWGGLQLKGEMTQANLKFTSFSANGAPLRAEITEITILLIPRRDPQPVPTDTSGASRTDGGSDGPAGGQREGTQGHQSGLPIQNRPPPLPPSGPGGGH